MDEWSSWEMGVANGNNHTKKWNELLDFEGVKMSEDITQNRVPRANVTLPQFRRPVRKSDQLHYSEFAYWVLNYLSYSPDVQRRYPKHSKTKQVTPLHPSRPKHTK